LPPSIPVLPGSYALQLRLADQQELQVGRLGKFDFPPGEYVYIGSALGPGGLQKRLNRHLRGFGRLHWHIDWLRAKAHVTGYYFITSTSRLECAWSQALINHPSARVPAHGFGASDCRDSENPCLAHLVWLQPGTSQMKIREVFSQVSGSQVTYRKFTSDS
jgi:Uri superfamily endonuclease